MEVAPRNNFVFKDQRIICRRVYLYLEHFAGMLEGLPGSAVDLRHAAQRVSILYHRAIFMAFHEIAVFEQASQVAGRSQLARMRV